MPTRVPAPAPARVAVAEAERRLDGRRAEAVGARIAPDEGGGLRTGGGESRTSISNTSRTYFEHRFDGRFGHVCSPRFEHGV